MDKYEAFGSGQFLKVIFTGAASTLEGRKWAQGIITYKRHEYELPITEDFQIDLGACAAAPALLEALEAANVPHTMPAVHKMTDVVAGCPGCMARAAIAQANGDK